MNRYILNRFFQGLLVLLTVAGLTFVLMHTVPGGPFSQEKTLPPEILANIEAKYHLDKPLWQQFFLYLSGLAKGDLGPSYKYLGRTVNDIIGDTLPVSLQLGLLAFAVSLLLGFPAGAIAGLRKDRWQDQGALIFATLGVSVPNFAWASLFILLFGIKLRLLPVARWESWQHMVLPAVTLGLYPAAYIARLVRSSIIDTMSREYIRTARAKGLSNRQIFFKHILKNSMVPVVTILGPLLAVFITGSFIVEYIFAIPGMGRFFVTAVSNRDYPLIMGITLVFTTFIVIANILVDISYAFLDPRIRLKKS